MGNHVKQTQTDVLPPPFSTSSGRLAVNSITGLLGSTNWFFQTFTERGGAAISKQPHTLMDSSS